jgi:hypothetical protein
VGPCVVLEGPDALLPAPPLPPRLASGTFFGVGVRAGWPALAGLDVAFRLGPIAAEVGGCPRLPDPYWFRDRWVRAGLLVPVADLGDSAVRTGVVAGWRDRLVRGFDARQGPTAALASEWTGHTSGVVVSAGLTAGVDWVDTPFAYVDGSRWTLVPVLETHLRLWVGR